MAMSDILDKLSSYNIFNYLLPDTLFAVAGDAFTSNSFAQKVVWNYPHELRFSFFKVMPGVHALVQDANDFDPLVFHTVVGDMAIDLD